MSGESAKQQKARLLRTIRGLPQADQSWVLHYLAGYRPDAVDLAVSALAGQLSRSSLPPDPV